MGNGDEIMKKILASIMIIVLVAFLGAAILLAYNSHKDLELKKEEAKLENKKEDKTNNSITSKNEKASQANKMNETNNQKAKNLENAYAINSNDAQILANEIDRADVNGDGIITTNEMTPTLYQFAKAGKFQPSGGGATSQEYSEEAAQPKYTAEDAKNMSDDEFLAAYKEGMTKEEAAAVDEAASGPGDYVGFLRGQVEARDKGQGGNY